MIDIINNVGTGVIDTLERVRTQVQQLWDKPSEFGCMLQMGHGWANHAAIKGCAELCAAEIILLFQGQAQPTLDVAARASLVRDDPV